MTPAAQHSDRARPDPARPEGDASLAAVPEVRRRKRGLPTWTHGPASLAIRAAIGVPMIAGARASGHAADRIGRGFASLSMNRKRVDRAIRHLVQAFPESTEDERERLAGSAYAHLLRLGVELAHMPRWLTDDGYSETVKMGEMADALRPLLEGKRVLYLTGHCGNWEVLGYTMAVLGFPMHALYRPLDMKPLDQWLRRTRERRGLTLVDKFGAADELPGLIERGIPVGFVADQNAGDRGLFVPFFGRLASTYKTIGLLAIRYQCVVVCAQARRVVVPGQPAGFRIEIGDVIDPSDYEAAEDPLYYLTARYRRAIEQMVRNAPEQYLWMHRIWKSRPRHERSNRPFPAGLRRKLESLPWLDDHAVDALVDRSDRDRAYLAEIGQDRLP